MSKQEILKYEVHASWWVKHISNPVLQQWAARYYGWKVRRKWRRYDHSLKIRAELIALGVPLNP